MNLHSRSDALHATELCTLILYITRTMTENFQNPKLKNSSKYCHHNQKNKDVLL